MTRPAPPAPRMRAARAADAEAVRDCAQAAYARYIPRIGRAPAPMGADVEAQIAAGQIWIAETAEGRLLGYVAFFPEGGAMHLDAVAVWPEMAGHGIGRALIGLCEARARATGLGAVTLYTNAAMTENLRLYPRLGYRETGRRVDEGFRRVFFEKPLGLRRRLARTILPHAPPLSLPRWACHRSAMTLRPHMIATIALGLPLIGSHLARMAIGVTDTIMVGRYGVEPLAALVLATSVFFLLYMLGSGYGIGVMGRIAAALARGDETDVRRSTRMALWLSALHATLMAPVLWYSGPILRGLGQTADVAALGQDWLRVMILAMPAVLGGLTLNSFLAALGRANIVLWVTLAGLPLNAVLNWALIFGIGPIPALGVSGSALASLTVNWLQLAALVWLAASLPQAKPFSLWQRFWRPDWPAFRAIAGLGLPIGLTLVAETGMFTGTNILMGWFGAEALAAHGIALQIAALAFMLQLGLSNAATIRIGAAQGMGDAEMMRGAAIAGVVLSFVVAAATMALFVIAPRTLTGLYLDPTEPAAPVIIALAARLMFLGGLFQIFDGLQAMALGLLRGVQDTRVPMLLAVVSYWLIGLPMGWALAFPAGLGPAGLWVGLVAGLAVAALLLLGRFWLGGLGRWLRPAARLDRAGAGR